VGRKEEGGAGFIERGALAKPREINRVGEFAGVKGERGGRTERGPKDGKDSRLTANFLENIVSHPSPKKMVIRLPRGTGETQTRPKTVVEESERQKREKRQHSKLAGWK